MQELGTQRKNVVASIEYSKMAEGDEKIGELLFTEGEYRHAIYFFIQAMEKYTRSKIFEKADPLDKSVRDINKTHSLKEALTYWTEKTKEEKLQEETLVEIDDLILGGTNFRQLHNSLRYPFYSKVKGYYSVMEFGEEDCQHVRNCMENLKVYLDIV